MGESWGAVVRIPPLLIVATYGFLSIKTRTRGSVSIGFLRSEPFLTPEGVCVCVCTHVRGPAGAHVS